MFIKIFKFITRKRIKLYSIKDSRSYLHQAYLYFLHKNSEKYLNRTKEIKNSYKNERCFIFFTDTSINEFNFDLIKGENVIASGMSFVHKDFEKCNIVSFFNPGPWSPKSLEILDFYFRSIYKKTQNGCHVICDSTAYPYRNEISSYREKDTYYISTNGSFLSSKDINSELHELNNIQEGSLPLGIAIASYLGFKEIYLLGQDYLNDPPIYGHFYDGFHETVNSSDYKSYRERASWMIEHVNKKGCKVINVIKDKKQKSSIESITFEDLESLLN